MITTSVKANARTARYRHNGLTKRRTVPRTNTNHYTHGSASTPTMTHGTILHHHHHHEQSWSNPFTPSSHLRVPVTIIQNARVGTLQVDAETAGPRREQKCKLIRALKGVCQQPRQRCHKKEIGSRLQGGCTRHGVRMKIASGAMQVRAIAPFATRCRRNSTFTEI